MERMRSPGIGNPVFWIGGLIVGFYLWLVGSFLQHVFVSIGG